MNQFIDFYNNIKPKIEENINSFNEELLKEKNQIIKYNLELFTKLNSKGKMIRGTLIALGYSFNNNNINYSIPLSCAYEVFETSILVHDDIVDKDTLRRGETTISYANKEKYNKHNDNDHIANSIALCIGDYGLYKANELIINNYMNDKHFSELFKTYNDIVLKTIKGEILDIVISYEEKNHLFKDDLEDNIINIYKLKTSYYTLVGPLYLGMVLGGNSIKEIEDIENFALPLGIAFQIQDDLLGIFSDDSTLGKTIGSDIKEFKQTLLYSYIKNTDYYDELIKHYGNEKFKLNTIRDIFTKSGAKDYCITKMNELYDKSIEILNNIKWLNPDHKNILNDLITYLKNRQY